MLVIKNMKHHKKQLAEAAEDGSIEKLREQLQYLHCYGGMDDPNKFRVELGYDRSGYGVVWFVWSEADKEHKFFMNGGLIHFESDNSWSVHT